jgi:hypothetical protein
MRTLRPAALLLLVSFSAGCGDDAASMQDAANKAQHDANTKITEVRVDADQDIRNAQTEADKQIAAQSASFALLREDYRHSVTLKMVTLDKKVADIQARADKANGKERAALQAKLADVELHHADFMKSFDALDAETALTWDATRVRLDAQWADVQARVDAV